MKPKIIKYSSVTYVHEDPTCTVFITVIEVGILISHFTFECFFTTLSQETLKSEIKKKETPQYDRKKNHYINDKLNTSIFLFQILKS